MDIKVINAGLCRTGTMSSRKALIEKGWKLQFQEFFHFSCFLTLIQPLTDLGFGNCYHMQECFARNHPGIWMDCLKAGKFSPIMQVLAENNFQSGSDLPFCAIFEDFMKEYPEAKVLLTVRDDPEKWLESWKKTVRQVNLLPWYCEILRLCPSPLYWFTPSINNEFHDLFWGYVIRKEAWKYWSV